MTRQEQTGNRKHDLFFSEWIREKLPDSYTGYRCYDVDFVLWHKELKQIMFIELKSYNTEVKSDQHLILKNLHNWIKNGIDEDWTYKGLHLIQFEQFNFENGKVYLDKKETTEEELINFLTFN
tara:strand:- start:122 stop:490 length:369 start_codon:yes stop_codon:yes gene_type:complete